MAKQTAAEKKDEVIAKLNELGIVHDPKAKFADLEKLLPTQGSGPTSDKEEESTGSIEIVAEDPEVLRPKELPLLIKPAKGDWANPAQAEYARILNGYAYKNPDKWRKKKDVLLKQLAELEKNPGLLVLLKGGKPVAGEVSFTNHAFGGAK